jgi:hypothetical protein
LSSFLEGEINEINTREDIPDIAMAKILREIEEP